ncbi:XkdW family protein [Paenibacillus sp. MMO-177]|uniref:XkdW family protein n=1 Tax=Paenibacillus sp. MMO-177 TaxID=3081289 RepID=UPI003015F777
MNIAKALSFLFPEAVPFKDYSVYWVDEKAQIVNWNLPVDAPSDEELMAASLAAIKQEKIAELEACCSQVISDKFEHDGLFYSNSMQSQSEFMATARAFDQGLLTETKWTAYDKDGVLNRLTFDKDGFNSLFMASLSHISDNIAKLRDIKQSAIVECGTEEEVEAIHW